MTDPKTRLAEIRARMALPVLPTLYAADVPWLLERIAHLEGLVEKAKDAAGLDHCDANGCPWCWQYAGDPHKGCPAFTANGEIK